MLWCKCTECARMPITSKCLCCKELDMGVGMLKEARVADDNIWITNHHRFQCVVTHKAVLRATLVDSLMLLRTS